MTRIYIATIEALIILGLTTMVALTFTSTLIRVAGYGGIFWAEEVTRYISIWVVFLAGGLGVRYGIHLSVDMVVATLPPWGQRVMHVFACLMVLLFASVLLWYGMKLSISNYAQRSASLQMRMTYANAAIPVGAALMIFETLRLLVLELQQKPHDPSRTVA